MEKTKKGALPVPTFLLFALLLLCISAALWLFGDFFIKGKSSFSAVSTPELPVIVIDAGHGGRDGGAVGVCNGVIEKDLNLYIALELERLFTESGYRVVMTRREDIMLEDPYITSSKKASDLSARLKILREVESAIFISIHMNAFSDSSQAGLQVYYSPNNQRSAGLAFKIQSKVKEELQNANRRKTKAAGDGIYLLKKAECPAVLIECGFLSNPAECSSLSTVEYKNALALSICRAVSDYISENY